MIVSYKGRLGESMALNTDHVTQIVEVDGDLLCYLTDGRCVCMKDWTLDRLQAWLQEA